MIRVCSLDTNIVSAFLAGEQAVIEHIERAAQTGIVVLAPVVTAELLYGSTLKSNPEKLLRNIQQFVARAEKPVIAEVTAQIWADIKARLRKRGITIPDNDIWIAASAIEFGHTVISRDKHFSYIDGLLLEAW